MAFSNRSRHYHIAGEFSGAERDEFGYTKDDYVRMMDDVASKYVRLLDIVDSSITKYSRHR